MLVFSFLLGLIVNNAWGLDYWLSTKKTTDFLFPNLEYSKRQLRIIPEPYEYTTSNYPPLLVNKTTVLHIDYRLPQYFVKLLNQEFTDLFKDSLTCVLDSFKSYTPLFLINNTYAKNTKGYFDFFF